MLCVYCIVCCVCVDQLVFRRIEDREKMKKRTKNNKRKHTNAYIERTTTRIIASRLNTTGSIRRSVWIAKERIKNNIRNTKLNTKNSCSPIFSSLLLLSCSSRGPTHFCFVLTFNVQRCFASSFTHFSITIIAISLSTYSYACFCFCFYFCFNIEPMLIVIVCFSPKTKRNKKQWEKRYKNKRRAEKNTTPVLFSVV